jgi:REP element-mobilizing transposase RayT
MGRKTRGETIDPTRCLIYHICTRCVHRRALLVSENDAYKLMIYQLFRLLDEHFAIEVVAYDIMDNHLHLVIRLDPRAAQDWADREVVTRWFGSHLPRGKAATERCIEKHLADDVWVQKHREALASPSQFMKDLKQRIAERINAAEGLEGHFWQGRFEARAIETYEDLVAVCAYVDLNDVKAGLCDDPRMAAFCSAAERAASLAAHADDTGGAGEHTWLVPIADGTAGDAGAASREIAADCVGSHRGRGLFPGASVGDYLGLLTALARAIRQGCVQSSRAAEPGARRLGTDLQELTERVLALFENPRWSPD